MYHDPAEHLVAERHEDPPAKTLSGMRSGKSSASWVEQLLAEQLDGLPTEAESRLEVLGRQEGRVVVTRRWTVSKH